ncbi:MAG: 30S ribosomal protein S20 [Treponema sp.]
MANNTSAIKRHKQSEVRRIHNKAVKSSARTCAKKYTAAVVAKDAESAGTLLRELAHQLDTAARKGIITKNAAARKKSRMQKLYNVTFSAK